MFPKVIFSNYYEKRERQKKERKRNSALPKKERNMNRKKINYQKKKKKRGKKKRERKRNSALPKKERSTPKKKKVGGEENNIIIGGAIKIVYFGLTLELQSTTINGCAL